MVDASTTGDGMNGGRSIPDNVFAHLRNGLVFETAHYLLAGHPEQPVLHPGEAFGQVLTWLWRTDQDAAMKLVVDLLASVRYHAPGSDKNIRLDDLLAGIAFSIHAMSDEEAGALLARARTAVPDHFDADITSRPGEG
jgi:hypothetical protein